MPCCLSLFSVIPGVFAVTRYLGEKLLLVPEFSLSAGEMIKENGDLASVGIIIIVENVRLDALVFSAAVHGRIDADVGYAVICLSAYEYPAEIYAVRRKHLSVRRRDVDGRNAHAACKLFAMLHHSAEGIRSG